MAEMQAGREMDAQIAERVMGWRHVERGYVHLVDPDEYRARLASGHWFESSGREDVRLDRVPQYSTEIAGAWQVIEEMHRRCWRFSGGDDYGVIGVRTGFTVQLEEHDHKAMTGREARGEGETFPLAICRAALKALEAR